MERTIIYVQKTELALLSLLLRIEIVNILLNNGADTSLACGWDVNPSLVGCFDKPDCVVEIFLQNDNISNNLYDPDSYFSLYHVRRKE